MTAKDIPFAGASPTQFTNWEAIPWCKVQKQVRRLQMRIAKAFREGKHHKAKALGWILTHSHYAKLLAVKRVVTNRGAHTPGVDKILWKTSKQKLWAVSALKRRGYQPKPLKRIYIPKKQKGKLRPLSIPTMEDRAQQALHLLALEPMSEVIADPNAYGFRPYRSTADAIEQCFLTLSRKASAQWILEGDIRSCFDTISHPWLLKHTPMDRKILGKWLSAGYLEENTFKPTEMGTPQGGIISPTLLTVTLSGLEQVVAQATTRRDKVNVVSYADDFIITGASKEVLENKVKPAVATFLEKRGLALSLEKTKITHIDEGFDFLGMNVRKYKGKLIIKPAKSSVKRFLTNIREIIKCASTDRTELLIQVLNRKIQGWTQYYRHVCSKQTYARVDCEIFKALWRWAKRRHPNKGKRWIQQRYVYSIGLRHWVFYAKSRDGNGEPVIHTLNIASQTPIRRHIKIQSKATPYDPDYFDYFKQRLSRSCSGELCRHPGETSSGRNRKDRVAQAALREARAV